MVTVRKDGAQRTTTIYDPNFLNPYGLELASTIVAAGPWTARLLAPRTRARSVVPGVQILGVLSAVDDPALLKPVTRFLAPFRAIAASRRGPLIIVWTRDAFDSLLFSVRAWVGLPTYFIYHNPPSLRERPGLGGAGERLLARVAVTCAHSSFLASQIENTRGTVRITPHPSYIVSTKNATLRSDKGPDEPESTRHRFAILGSLRTDKGAGLLPTIAAESGGGWDLVVIGPDRLSTAITQVLRTLDVGVEYPSTAPPSDDEMHRMLLSCSALLAPYSSVTESGSVILAQSLGVSTLGLKSVGLSAILTDRSVADDGEGLGRLVTDFCAAPWDTYQETAGERQTRAIEAWRTILETSP